MTERYIYVNNIGTEISDRDVAGIIASAEILGYSVRLNSTYGTNTLDLIGDLLDAYIYIGGEKSYPDYKKLNDLLSRIVELRGIQNSTLMGIYRALAMHFVDEKEFNEERIV